MVAIWLLNESLFPGRQAWHLPFDLLNREHGIVLSDHVQMHLLQLSEWQMRDEAIEELDRWMYLFTAGEDVDVEHPPAILQTEEMRQVMQVLQHFSENERAYLLYQSRLEAELVENTWKGEISRLQQAVDEAKQREAAERQEKEAERQAKEAERQEKERLLTILKQAGIDPDHP